MKKIHIGRCYGQSSIVLTKGISLRQIADALRELEGHEVTAVRLVKATPATEDPWRNGP